MKFILTVLIISFSLTITAQDSFMEADAKGIIDTFFDGFHKGDTLIMKSVLAENVTLQSASADKEGKNILSETAVNSRFIKCLKKIFVFYFKNFC